MDSTNVKPAPKLPAGLHRWDIFFDNGLRMEWAFDVVAQDKKRAVSKAVASHWRGADFLPTIKAQASVDQNEKPDYNRPIPPWEGRAYRK